MGHIITSNEKKNIFTSLHLEEQHLFLISKYVFFFVKLVRSSYCCAMSNILTCQSLRRVMTKRKFFWPVNMTGNSSKFILISDIIQQAVDDYPVLHAGP